MHSERKNEPDRAARFPFLSKDELWVLLNFATSRLAIVAVMLLSRQMIARGPHVEISGQLEHGGTLLDLFTHSDGVWYRMIAHYGYEPPSHPLAPSFFPFYPILIRFAPFFFRAFQIPSLLFSNVFFIP